MAKKHNELLIDYPYLDLDQNYVRNEKLYFRRNILLTLSYPSFSEFFREFWLQIAVKINLTIITKNHTAAQK